MFLKVFGNSTANAVHFPVTMMLIESIQCTTAYFSILEPGTIIPVHQGLYKGVLRYHLGLIVPDDIENVFISVDGQTLHWREGDDIMFDDMYDHYVINNTNQPRAARAHTETHTTRRALRVRVCAHVVAILFYDI